MPARLDRVLVETPHGRVELPLDSRDALLERLGKAPSGNEVVAAFEVAGATPVTLTDEQRRTLYDVVHEWLLEVGVEKVPEGIFALRHRVVDEDAAAD